MPLSNESQSTQELEAKKSKEELETDKLILEKKKIAEDIETGKWNNGGGRIASLVVPSITAALTLIGIIFGLWQFFRKADIDSDAANAQRTFTNETKREDRVHELLKQFAQNQFTTYVALCKAASTVAAYPDGDARSKDAYLSFINVYRGDALIVGDSNVIKSMNSFYDCASHSDLTCVVKSSSDEFQAEIQHRSRILAIACRKSIAATSKTDTSTASGVEELLQVPPDEEIDSYQKDTELSLP